MKNKDGYTLIEILIALTILAIMATPVLNVFIDSIGINKMADDQYVADIISQKFIEEYRGGNMPPASDTTVIYEGFTVRTVYASLENGVANPSGTIRSSYEAPTVFTAIDLYETPTDKIGIRGGVFDLNNLNLNPNTYTLRVESPLDNLYKIDLIYDKDGSLVTQQVASVSDTPINIKITKPLDLVIEDSQRTTFNVLNSTDKNVSIYVYNDQPDNLRFTISTSSNTVTFIRNLTTEAHISSNDLISYDVEITVSKNNTEYTKLRTVISK